MNLKVLVYASILIYLHRFMKSVRTVAMYFPEASASRYEYTSNSPTLHSIYNKSIYMKVRETRLLITFITLNFAEFQEVGNK